MPVIDGRGESDEKGPGRLPRAFHSYTDGARLRAARGERGHEHVDVGEVVDPAAVQVRDRILAREPADERVDVGEIEDPERLGEVGCWALVASLARELRSVSPSIVRMISGSYCDSR